MSRKSRKIFFKIQRQGQADCSSCFCVVLGSQVGLGSWSGDATATVSTQYPQAHAPLPRQGELRVPASNHQEGGERGPHGGLAGGGQ